MHVLKLPSWYPTPAFPVRGTFFRQQGLALAACGHQVGLVYPDLRGLHTLHRGRIQFGYRYFADGPIRTYHYYGFRLPRRNSAFRKRWTSLAARLIDAYVAHHGVPDIIHAHCAIFGGHAAARIAKELSVPYVLTEHSSAFLTGTLTPLQTTCAIDAVADAHAVIAVSHRLSAALRQIAGRNDIHVIPNVVDTKRFPVSTAGPEADIFRFACVAMLTPLKNVELLLRAFHRAFRTNESVLLDIVGDGPERSRLLRIMRTMSERHRIRFHGSLDSLGVAKTLGGSHCCVSSSDVETFAVTLIEALAAGLPVVATRSGGPQDIVNSACGHLVPVGDETALAEAMYQVYTRREGWAKRRHVLSAYADRTYGYNAAASRLEAVYRSL